MDYTIGYLPHPEGDFNQSSPYTPMAVVHLNGESFISKVNVPAGIIPRVSTNWTNYWQVFAEGTQGNQGATGAGTQGSQGTTGTQGNQGATGAGTQGSQGSQGPAGTSGKRGADGSSIFFYLEPLHDGQELDQNKIVNPLRLDVLPGSTVTDVTGQVGYIDDNKKWIYSYTIHQGAQGSTGSTGAQGADGAQGIQGVAGHSPANTEQWSFTLIDNSILNRTVYMVPQS